MNVDVSRDIKSFVRSLTEKADQAAGESDALLLKRDTYPSHDDTSALRISNLSPLAAPRVPGKPDFVTMSPSPPPRTLFAHDTRALDHGQYQPPQRRRDYGEGAAAYVQQRATDKSTNPASSSLLSSLWTGASHADAVTDSRAPGAAGNLHGYASARAASVLDKLERLSARGHSRTESGEMRGAAGVGAMGCPPALFASASSSYAPLHAHKHTRAQAHTQLIDTPASLPVSRQRAVAAARGSGNVLPAEDESWSAAQRSSEAYGAFAKEQYRDALPRTVVPALPAAAPVTFTANIINNTTHTQPRTQTSPRNHTSTQPRSRPRSPRGPSAPAPVPADAWSDEEPLSFRAVDGSAVFRAKAYGSGVDEVHVVDVQGDGGDGVDQRLTRGVWLPAPTPAPAAMGVKGETQADWQSKEHEREETEERRSGGAGAAPPGWALAAPSRTATTPPRAHSVPPSPVFGMWRGVVDAAAQAQLARETGDQDGQRTRWHAGKKDCGDGGGADGDGATQRWVVESTPQQENLGSEKGLGVVISRLPFSQLSAFIERVCAERGDEAWEQARADARNHTHALTDSGAAADAAMTPPQPSLLQQLAQAARADGPAAATGGSSLLYRTSAGEYGHWARAQQSQGARHGFAPVAAGVGVGVDDDGAVGLLRGEGGARVGSVAGMLREGGHPNAAQQQHQQQRQRQLDSESEPGGRRFFSVVPQSAMTAHDGFGFADDEDCGVLDEHVTTSEHAHTHNHTYSPAAGTDVRAGASAGTDASTVSGAPSVAAAPVQPAPRAVAALYRLAAQTSTSLGSVLSQRGSRSPRARSGSPTHAARGHAAGATHRGTEAGAVNPLLRYLAEARAARTSAGTSAVDAATSTSARATPPTSDYTGLTLPRASAITRMGNANRRNASELVAAVMGGNVAGAAAYTPTAGPPHTYPTAAAAQTVPAEATTVAPSASPARMGLRYPDARAPTTEQSYSYSQRVFDRVNAQLFSRNAPTHAPTQPNQGQAGALTSASTGPNVGAAADGLRALVLSSTATNPHGGPARRVLLNAVPPGAAVVPLNPAHAHGDGGVRTSGGGGAGELLALPPAGLGAGNVPMQLVVPRTSYTSGKHAHKYHPTQGMLRPTYDGGSPVGMETSAEKPFHRRKQALFAPRLHPASDHGSSLLVHAAGGDGDARCAVVPKQVHAVEQAMAVAKAKASGVPESGGHGHAEVSFTAGSRMPVSCVLDGTHTRRYFKPNANIPAVVATTTTSSDDNTSAIAGASPSGPGFSGFAATRGFSLPVRETTQRRDGIVVTTHTIPPPKPVSPTTTPQPAPTSAAIITPRVAGSRKTLLKDIRKHGRALPERPADRYIMSSVYNRDYRTRADTSAPTQPPQVRADGGAVVAPSSPARDVIDSQDKVFRTVSLAAMASGQPATIKEQVMRQWAKSEPPPPAPSKPTTPAWPQLKQRPAAQSAYVSNTRVHGNVVAPQTGAGTPTHAFVTTYQASFTGRD